jgi:DNA polymerase-3 subunit delta'
MAAYAELIILHPATQKVLETYITDPAHAVLVTGPKGSGKASLARHMSSGLIGDGLLSAEAYEQHPFIRIIRPLDGKSIPIDTIRELQHFLSLAIPGRARTITRIIVIEDAQLMTVEAQNALLKTLEEPPAGTVIIMTATALDLVLPTIQSRSRQLAVITPTAQQTIEFFISQGHSSDSINKTLLISGGLPGLTHALLVSDEQHPLFVATTHARGILQSKSYERLLLVDGLAKQKELCLDIFNILGRMSRMALTRSGDKASIDRWQKVMRATYDAEGQLNRSVQAKLVLTNFMLTI